MHALRILAQNKKNTDTLTSKLIFDQLSSACLHIINLQDSFLGVLAEEWFFEVSIIPRIVLVMK